MDGNEFIFENRKKKTSTNIPNQLSFHENEKNHSLKNRDSNTARYFRLTWLLRDYKEANFEHAELWAADLSGAELSKALFNRTGFLYANFSYVIFGEFDFSVFSASPDDTFTEVDKNDTPSPVALLRIAKKEQ